MNNAISIGLSDKYKSVEIWENDKHEKMYAAICRIMENGHLTYYRKYFDNERDAAKYVDIFKIQNGKKPLNILVKNEADTSKTEG